VHTCTQQATPSTPPLHRPLALHDMITHCSHSLTHSLQYSLLTHSLTALLTPTTHLLAAPAGCTQSPSTCVMLTVLYCALLTHGVTPAHRKHTNVSKICHTKRPVHRCTATMHAQQQTLDAADLSGPAATMTSVNVPLPTLNPPPQTHCPLACYAITVSTH
jgi:hypothetical protein